jgi:RsiW-degrading membrane proteinase PrsW (M82 family)
MSALVLGGSAVVPSLLLLWYVYARDRNPEPRGLLVKTFLLGAAICLPVIPVALWLQSLGQGLAVGVWGTALVQAFLGAAIPEELFKYLVLRRYVWSQPAFDEPLDGVVYGTTASLGFATLENILYVSDGGMGVAVLRALTAVPGHAFTGVVMGAFVGRARFATDSTERFRLLASGFGWAVLLHGAYDAFLMTETVAALLALIVLGIEIRWGRRLFKALQAEQQAQADAYGVARQFVVAEQAQVLTGSGVPATVTSMSWGAELSVVRTPHPPAPPSRTFWSWAKLGLGGMGLTLCGVWWLGVAAVLFLDTSDEPLEPTVKVFLVVFSLIPSVLFALLFRSGLRGPFTQETSPVLMMR